MVMYVKHEDGFTLIEVLIYSAVVAVFLGLSFAAAHSVFRTSSILTARNELTVHEEFVERKLAWIMGHAKSISSPAPNTSSTTGFTITTHATSSDPAVFSFAGGIIDLALAGAGAANVSNNKVTISSFVATHYSNSQATSSLAITFDMQHVGHINVTSSVSFWFAVP